MLPILLLVGLAAAPASAADTTEFPTHVRVFYDYQSAAGGDWHTAGLAAGLRAGRVSGELVGLRTRRFGLTDYAAGADLYTPLWQRAYVYTGAHAGIDADVLPELDLRAELFQGTAGGWEPALGARWARYPAADIEVLTAALAKYLPRWYLRAGASYIPDADGLGYALLARRYLAEPAAGEPGALLEASVGGGDAVIEVRPAPETGEVVVDVRRSAFGTVRVQLFPAGETGFSAGVGAFEYEGLETRWTVSLALVRRW